MSRLRLRIGPVIQNALDVKTRVERELPGHTGLISLADGVAAAARQAEKAAQRLRRPFGVHRLPAAFLALALLIFVVWTYVQFFRTTKLKVALPDRDAHALRTRILEDRLLKFEKVEVPGSREAAELVRVGKADLGFVQGGIDIEPALPRLETPDPEIVLWFVRFGQESGRHQACSHVSGRRSGSHSGHCGRS